LANRRRRFGRLPRTEAFVEELAPTREKAQPMAVHKHRFSLQAEMPALG
jgi:hypothetical protein